MDREDYMAVLRRESDALAQAADGALDRPVGSCPGWSVADLVWHLGEVHYFWRCVASGLDDWEQYEGPERPADAQLVTWFRQGADELADLLAVADPSTPAMTWSHQKDVGFIQRRMAQETAVHRWDATAAVGQDEPIDPAVAVDGIDEYLDHFLPGRPAQLEGPTHTVHLHATDAPGEWVVRVGDGQLHVDRAHGKGDAAARGPASDLLLLLWGRRTADDVEVHGDRSTLEAFLARTDRN